LADFIDYLHRQDNETVKRRRETIAKALRMEKAYHEKRKITTSKILQFYEIAKRTGYLTGYELDKRDGTYTVDILHLDPSKFLHLRARRNKTESKQIEHLGGLDNDE
jgi:hypothetical protein